MPTYVVESRSWVKAYTPILNNQIKTGVQLFDNISIYMYENVENDKYVWLEYA